MQFINKMLIFGRTYRAIFKRELETRKKRDCLMDAAKYFGPMETTKLYQ